MTVAQKWMLQNIGVHMMLMDIVSLKAENTISAKKIANTRTEHISNLQVYY